MAIKLNIADSAIGVGFPEAYARVTRAAVDKANIHYNVEVHANAQARLDGKQPILMAKFVADTASVTGDILPGLYAHLKTQPGYENGEDC